MYIKHVTFQSTRLLRASTGYGMDSCSGIRHFNPQGSREPRPSLWVRTAAVHPISIHKALASLDPVISKKIAGRIDFNPQGSREPRPIVENAGLMGIVFQSTRLSRASTALAIL